MLIFCGCHVGPRYKAPPTTTAVKWKNPPSNPCPSIQFNHWWDLFEDALLSDLENQAIAHNYNYKVALEKVAVARAIAGVTKADLYPQISLNANYNYTKEFVKFHGDRSKVPIPGIKDKLHIRDQTYLFPNIFKYELDLWGRHRNIYKSALYQAQAEEDQARVVLLTLTSDLASNYFNLRTLDSQLSLLKQTESTLRSLLLIHQNRFAFGIDTGLDIAYAEENLSNIEAEYQDTLRQRILFENAIATLVGVAPSELNIMQAELKQQLPYIPIGLPSDLLKQRPDIAEAERKMASKHTLINVAYSSFFPSLALTGGGGLSSVQLQDFLNFKGYLWQVGANFVQSIFDAGRNRSTLHATKALFKQAEDSYQQVILTAFQDVENALSNIIQQSKQAEHLKQSLQASQKSTTLSNKRYQKGLVGQLELLNYEQSLLQTQRRFTNVMGARYQSTINLIKALGGSWESSTEACVETTKLPPLTYKKQ
ncbi:MAG: efflux transporter outer membrane subunit [Chlamydiota bacterium]